MSKNSKVAILLENDGGVLRHGSTITHPSYKVPVISSIHVCETNSSAISTSQTVSSFPTVATALTVPSVSVASKNLGRKKKNVF